METKTELANQKRPDPTSSRSLLTSFLAGALSGSCSTVLLQPFDLVKTRVQQRPHSTVWEQARQVARTEGLLAFWTGVTPSLWRTVPGIGLHFASYHLLSSLVSDGSPLSSLQSLTVGGLARVFAGVVLMPVTVVKTRWEAGEGKFSYKGGGVLGALKTILSQEGVRGLASGLLPTILRDAPYSAIYLMFYNKLKQLTAAQTEHSATPLTHFSCGLLAGALATVLVQPADVVKTELQLSQERVSHWTVLTRIHSARGVRGFFVGLAPRVVRKSLMSALAWTVYERATSNLFTKSKL